jgi:NADH dehydrogenase FAD-containing subunit
VAIVGGGFGGLNAAQALARQPVRVTLVDRRNHHLFQPLLYQVATAALFLIGFKNRFVVLFQWAWAYITYQRGARLISEPWKGRGAG